MMKNPFLSSIAALCCWLPLGISPLAQAADPETQEPAAANAVTQPHIRVQVEFVEISHELLTELMAAATPSANDADLRQQVAQLVKDGKAKVMETLLCTGRSGQKSTTESIEEFIYPTEYEPAQYAKEPTKTEPADPGRRETIGPTPTAFDTRNLGSTLEIEPTLSEDGRRINLRFLPEIVYHVGNSTWGEWKDEHGSVPIQMPTMYAVRLNTTVTLANGKPLLAGALTPRNDQGIPDTSRKLMVFVKADVLPE